MCLVQGAAFCTKMKAGVDLWVWSTGNKYDSWPSIL